MAQLSLTHKLPRWTYAQISIHVHTQVSIIIIIIIIAAALVIISTTTITTNAAVDMLMTMTMTTTMMASGQKLADITSVLQYHHIFNNSLIENISRAFPFFYLHTKFYMPCSKDRLVTATKP